MSLVGPAFILIVAYAQPTAGGGTESNLYRRRPLPRANAGRNRNFRESFSWLTLGRPRSVPVKSPRAAAIHQRTRYRRAPIQFD